MLTYLFIHQKAINSLNLIENSYECGHVEDLTNVEYVPPYRIYKLSNGSITIEVYAYIKIPYKIILETLHNYLPNKDAEITIVTTLGRVSQIFIQPMKLSPNYVGHQIPKAEIYERVKEIVNAYYPNFEYSQFTNGFLVRPLGFVNVTYWNDMVSELIDIYNNNYEIWISFAANRGIVISIAKRY